MNQFPNARGVAQRSPMKTVRVGTHVPVLKMCIDASNEQIMHVVEHGMGLASTQYFHSLRGVTRLLSFENDPKWQRCIHCEQSTSDERLSQIEHIIVPFAATTDDAAKLGVDTFQTLVSKHIVPTNSLALVDGPHVERIKVLCTLLGYGVPYIVEHDAESLPLDELDERLNLCRVHGYTALQYVALNPETMLYTTRPFEHSDFIRV